MIFKDKPPPALALARISTQLYEFYTTRRSKSMKNITIYLSNIQNNIRTNNHINTATHDLALYLMLKYKLFRSADNKVYSFTDNTLKLVDLRSIINEEIAPVQANTHLVNKVTSYFTYIGTQNTLKRYFRVANGNEAKDSTAGLTYKAVNEVLTEEVQRLEKLRAKVTIN